MSKNLVLNGALEKPIILWNRTKEVALDHSAKIGSSLVSDTAEEAVERADIIWSCFADQTGVVESFDRILQRNLKGKLFLECSTIEAETSNELAEKIYAACGEFVAMPGEDPPELQSLSHLADQFGAFSLWRTGNGKCCASYMSSSGSQRIGAAYFALPEGRVS